MARSEFTKTGKTNLFPSEYSQQNRMLADISARLRIGYSGDTELIIKTKSLKNI